MATHNMSDDVAKHMCVLIYTYCVLGWNFYRRINLHCHEAFRMKGVSRLFDRALIPGLAEERRTHWIN